MSRVFGRKGEDSTRVSLSEPPKSYAAVAKFDITPRPVPMLLAIGMGLTATLVLLAELFDPRALLINGIIELGPTGADIFFGVLIACSLAFAGIGLLGLVRSFGEKVWLSLDSRAIFGPRGWYLINDPIRIPYNEICSVRLQRINNQHIVTIKATDGRKIRVGSPHFRKEAEWREFLQELERRHVAALRS